MEEKIVLESLQQEQPAVAPSREQPVAPERPDALTENTAERGVQTPSGGERGAVSDERHEPVATSATPAQTAPVVKSEQLLAIEKILEEGLDDLFLQIPEGKRAAFKEEGEDLATAIDSLLQKATLKIVKVVKLIFHWLKMIPGVNRQYLEQESKLKADKIIALHEQRKNQI